ncbi:MAG: DinB family protein [Calditrichia bacterium]
MSISRPDSTEYAPFYAGYVAAVPESANVLTLLEQQLEDLDAVLAGVDEEKGLFRYAEGKWSIKELICHMSDAERVFGYRVLRFSRNDQTPLPGFEENSYITAAHADSRSLTNLVEEFKLLRNSNLMLFANLNKEQEELQGIASDNAMSVRALIYVTAGHVAHHFRIMRERYL